MKRKVMISIILTLLCFTGYSMFYNGFFSVEEIRIEDGLKTTNNETIGAITGILNRANKIKHTHYSLTVEPTYKIQLVYKDRNKEILYFYESFDKNETLIATDRSNNYYKINEKQTKKIIHLLLTTK
ncbi:hypothetical protein ACNA6I_23030 (plasmid) [Rossellomorea sp. FS2]|uniref:hypothetical protein n=1 Tax=Rossellomorea sp. FS2 TaxID=3391447 RepID=UPI003A4D2812